MIQKRTIGIVGTGNVGVAAAYAIFIRGLASEIILIDREAKQAEGEAMDLMHGQAFSESITVKAGDYRDLSAAQLVVITAGVAQKPGETRLDLLNRNAAVFKQIVGQLDRHTPGSGSELQIPFEIIKGALETIEGVQRRLEIKGEIQGITIVDDYGHHPTEIKTTLAAARDGWPDRRLVVVFQPHRYTRTRALFDEFTRAFYQSDLLVVLPIYPAGEAPIEGVDGMGLYEGIRAHGHKDAVYVDGIDQAVETLAGTLKPGDIVLTLGAGNVWQAGENLLERLKATH